MVCVVVRAVALKSESNSSAALSGQPCEWAIVDRFRREHVERWRSCGGSGIVRDARHVGGFRRWPPKAQKGGENNKNELSVSAKAKGTKKADAQSQPEKRLSPEALRVMREGVGEGIGQWVPMPGTDGTPGLFTIDTGDTLPKGGISRSPASRIAMAGRRAR